MEALSEAAAGPADPRGRHEWAAIVLVLLGGFVVGFGWIVGLVFLWTSRAWKTWEKWLATLVVPGGLAGGVYFGLFVLVIGASQSCLPRTNGRVGCASPSTVSVIVSIALLAVAILGPIAVAIFLARRAKTPAALR